MSTLEAIRVAFHSLNANKLRAGLTMLGVIIGVAAVIALVSIGRGAQAAITGQISSVGTNLLFVRPGAAQEAGVKGAQGSAATLTLEDGDAIDGVPGINAIAPEVQTAAQIVYRGSNLNVPVIGVTPAYQDVRHYRPARGDFIEEVNIKSNALVVALGSGVARTLFGDQDPLGQTIRISNIPFRVIGVMESKGGTGKGSPDNQVYIPLSTAGTRIAKGARYRGGSGVDVLTVELTSASTGPAVTAQISEILRDRHHAFLADDFTVVSQQDLLDAANAVADSLTTFLGGIAAISLVVGGIGIMNVMLTAVSERTREIGIRKAVGARRVDILAQFLTEAIVLSLIGGAVGVAVGWGISKTMGRISMSGTLITPRVDPDAILMAVGFAVAVGLFFGIYPAMRASSLNPIEALRYE